MPSQLGCRFSSMAFEWLASTHTSTQSHSLLMSITPKTWAGSWHLAALFTQIFYSTLVWCSIHYLPVPMPEWSSSPLPPTPAATVMSSFSLPQFTDPPPNENCNATDSFSFSHRRRSSTFFKKLANSSLTTLIHSSIGVTLTTAGRRGAILLENWHL